MAEDIAKFWNKNSKVSGSILYNKKNPSQINLKVADRFPYIKVNDLDLNAVKFRDTEALLMFERPLVYFLYGTSLSKEELQFISPMLESLYGINIRIIFRIGHTGSSGGHFSSPNKEIVVFVEENAFKKASLLKSSEVKKLIAVRTIVHELAHFYDYYVSKGKYVTKDYVSIEKNIDLYAGQQLEMNARFYDAVQYALPWKYNIAQPYNYKEFSSRVYSRVLWGNYDEKQKKAILKRTYTEYNTLDPIEKEIVLYHNLSLAVMAIDSTASIFPEEFDLRTTKKDLFFCYGIS